MNTISIRLPKSIHEAARKLAEEDQVSIDQFVTTALVEKISALKTKTYLMERAKIAPNRKEFEKLMEKVPDVWPDKEDQL